MEVGPRGLTWSQDSTWKPKAPWSAEPCYWLEKPGLAGQPLWVEPQPEDRGPGVGFLLQGTSLRCRFHPQDWSGRLRGRQLSLSPSLPPSLRINRKVPSGEG